MEQEIQKIMKVAGNEHRYQFLIIFLCFLIWAFAPMFSCVLGFLENTPSVSYYDGKENETVVEPMDYDICDWDKSIYVIVEEPKYSWAIDLNIECDKMKISMLGMLVSLGSLLGSATSSTVTEKLGQGMTLKVLNGIFFVILILSIFINKYWYYCITTLIVPYCCNGMLFSVMVLFNEIITVEHKSIYNTVINSGLGIGGVFYIIFFMIFNNWKYVFVCCLVIMVSTGLACHFFFIESPSSFAKKKDMKGFLNAIRYIAKFNKRLDYFNKEIEKPEYQECLKKIEKGEDACDDDNKDSNKQNKPEVKNVNSLPEPIDTPTQPINVVPTEVYDKENLQTDGRMLENLDDKGKINGIEKKESNDNLVEASPMTTIQNTPSNPQKPILTPNQQTPSIPLSQIVTPSEKKKDNPSTQGKVKSTGKILKANLWDLLKYSSVRGKFLIFCFLWMCTSMLYSGLVIGMKSLPGSLAVNSLILFIAESVGYFCAGPLMNNKKFGRKGAVMFFTAGFSLMCFLMVILFNHETVCVVFYILTRFFVMAGFCIYYTFCLESYPTSVKALAYGINGGSNNFGGVIIPFIIEYLERRWLYLLYACLGLGCTLILITRTETLGVPQPDNIPEMELEAEKEKMKNIPVVVV